MAITAPTLRSDFSPGFLNAEMSAPIFEDAARQSTAMRLFPQVPLGAEGKDIPIVLSKVTAGWAVEGGEKHKTKGSLDILTMSPKKLTAISVMSKEVVRANPGGYSTSMNAGFAEAFATAFDYAVFHNLGGDGTGTGPFTTAVANTTHAVTIGTAASLYLDIVGGIKLLNKSGKRVTGLAWDDLTEWLLLGAVDSNNKPLLQPSAAEGVYATVANKPLSLVPGLANGNTVGFLGDWDKGAWGVVGGISYDVSTQATVTINGQLVSLWENNMVAVLAEAEYGFVLKDAQHFATLNYTEAVS